MSENVIETENLSLIGSWTSFNKMVTEFKTEKCIQKYMPVCPHPAEYPVCKQYLDFLGEVILDLEIPYIFAHSDAAVYSKTQRAEKGGGGGSCIMIMLKL